MLARARGETDALFRLVRPDSFYERPIPERHRLIFYLGHLEAFDWNLIAGALGRPPVDATLDRLFAFGIDPPPGQLPQDQPSDWPSVEEVVRYCRRVREAVDAVELPEQLKHVALEHRLMHAETFTYILHQLPYERKLGVETAVDAGGAAFATGMAEVPAGPARLGLAPGEGFGWDNEFDAHVVQVPAFSIARHKVTNGEYLEFVRQGAAAPFFWVERDGRWFYRGMWRETPLPLDWPVYVTHDEATAYAKWRGMRLPSEAEWHRAACGSAVSRNADFASWDPIPVAEGESGIQQMIGNGWEWTSTVFGPFPGFRPFSFYQNYSEPFFDGRHFVLKGASPRTAACFLRPSFRNWFRSSYPYVYATFRLVEA
jgi:formylglycine-generating enzyme required for sulfatase activity